ncbi:MAG: efflux RND transporter periplasmic adaptor subunit [Bryobacteraceae bacterium]
MKALLILGVWTAAVPLLVLAQGSPSPAVETVKVVSKALSRSVKLPGELLPYESVEIYSRIPGFVERIPVDRGSRVKKGDLLVELSAPELSAQRAEAKARTEALVAQRAEAMARVASDEEVEQRLRKASQTPGAIAETEIEIAAKRVEAGKAGLRAMENSISAARSAESAVEKMQAYLTIRAPFDGVITERKAHPGALAGPSAEWLLKLEQNGRLRLVVQVPEAETATINRGARIAFTVPAFPGRTFSGQVARAARTLDAKSRTMPVEVEVANANGALAPGMFPEVDWPVRRAGASLLVPPTAIVTTTERSFVIRVTEGKAEWVDVRRGNAGGGLVEVTGALHEGDVILRRPSDEIRNGSKLSTK